MEKYKNLLTIILTLKDRSEFTYRYMKWMDENKCPYKILIADGGKNKKIEEHLKNYGNYKNLNYEYIRFPYDENLITFHKKRSDIIQKVKTPYMMWTDNDDFLILDYLKDKILFLETNKEYSCCSSRLHYFTVLKKNMKHDVNNFLYGENITLEFNAVSISSIDEYKSSDRAMKVITNQDCDSTWYGITRTNLSVLAHKKVYDDKLSCQATSEYYIALALSAFGKIAIDNKMHYFRQRNTSQNGTDDNFIGPKDFVLLMLTPEWQNDYYKMMKFTTSHLNKEEVDFQKNTFLLGFRQQYRKYIMPMITYPERHNKGKFLKIKNTILNSYFLSKIAFFIEKLLKIKIMPTIDIHSLKYEESVSKMINFMRKNENGPTIMP